MPAFSNSTSSYALIATTAPDTPISPGGNGQDAAPPSYLDTIAEKSTKAKVGKAAKREVSELPDEAQPAPELVAPAPAESRARIEDIVADDSVIGAGGIVSAKGPVAIKLKPIQKSKFFRIMPGRGNSLVINTLKLEREDTRPGEVDRFVLTNEMARYVREDLDYSVSKSVVHYCRYIQGQVFLTMVNASSDFDANTWNSSMREVLQQATGQWVRKVSDRDEQEYRAFTAVGEFKDKPWKVPPIKESFLVAMGKILIDSKEHPILRRLRGEPEHDHDDDADF
jgi:hypothetical protein